MSAQNIRASFDVTTQEGKIRAFNAQNGSSLSMKNLETGEVIDAVGVMQYEDTVDSYGKPMEVTITVIFGADGTSYASVSDTVAKAGENLIELVQDLGLETFRVAVIKANSSKGNEFINIRLVV